ncbi:ABC-type transport system involved in multi-copper enzyme maturation, permease component [Methanocella conradii HZ254]|uniref:ABC-type transport system involved in multi-copper enzyme maturation, permease component n=1 Tax=Methanocella conradii (strain DSM 24694 / JCM 17849 / CGMCC 1.5162 / HZ254) TaxID=1041930 RepID=H8I7B4_METCZ|nr:ABC transporter permease subunit [Methanocella conradii]AFD00780.1 ABC-type transport system involved in multi-copper enzyme maturation, permease component [Methanocella conradii HZ254]
MRPEVIVAAKEFKDYLTSKRFLLIFGVLLLISMAAIIAGISSYNSQLATYNEQKSMLSAMNSTAAARFQPQMPSMLLVFESFSSSFITVGWLLAIAIGFDLISKEKETGSLKLLLARPTYRDSIVNGKILGSASILVVSLAATFLVALAILLFAGIVPSGDDLLRMTLFFLMVILFSLTFLAIAIAASAIAKNSTMSILLAIGFVVFSLLLPSFMSSICDIVLGEAPTMVIPATGSSASATSSQVISRIGNETARMQMEINPEYTSYWNTRNQITEMVCLLSPTYDLQGISRVVVSGQQSPVSTSVSGQFQFREMGMSSPSLGSTLPSILPQVVALLVISMAGFAISYAKFVRMDVR